MKIHIFIEKIHMKTHEKEVKSRESSEELGHKGENDLWGFRKDTGVHGIVFAPQSGTDEAVAGFAEYLKALLGI